MSGSGPINGPNTAEQTAGVSALMILWAAGFIHVTWVNFTTRLALRARLSNQPPDTPVWPPHNGQAWPPPAAQAWPPHPQAWPPPDGQAWPPRHERGWPPR